MRRISVLFPASSLLIASVALSGCVGTLVDVATAPVKVVSKGVDLATTSQSERDEKRGREIRQREERLGKLERRYEDRMEDCQDGDRRACAEARDIYAEMQLLSRSLPVEPER